MSNSFHDLHHVDLTGGVNDNGNGLHHPVEKRVKREIANLNERRRMQNINQGFNSLRASLPKKHEGEKLSKAAILQHTAKYVWDLEKEMHRLLTENVQLKQMVGSCGYENAEDVATATLKSPEWLKRIASASPDCPSCKRRKYDNNNELDSSSPIGAGDDGGSSTESSSEQDTKSSAQRKIARQQRRSSSGSGNNCSLQTQLIRLEKRLQEEKRLSSMLEEELAFYKCKPINTNALSSGGHRMTASISRNGNYHFSNASESIQDEVEIASETLEIEMRSCPGSPQRQQNQHPANVIYLANPQYSTESNILNLHHQVQQTRSPHKQNAIALPIDAPYIGSPTPPDMDHSGSTQSAPSAPTTPPIKNEPVQPEYFMVLDQANNILQMIGSSKLQQFKQQHPQTLSSVHPPQQVIHYLSSQAEAGSSLKLVPSSSSSTVTNGGALKTVKIENVSQPDGSNISTADNGAAHLASRQNLNTIVEAIRHLEGDHLFPKDQPTVNKNDLSESVSTYQLLSTMASGVQVGKKSEASTKNQNRPNVIVATSDSGTAPTLVSS